MTYGYFNAFITEIGEDVPAKIDALKQYAEVIEIETQSHRPGLLELIDKLQPGDVVYVYEFLRFSSGLRDLDRLLDKIIDEKKAYVVSLVDDFDSRTPTGMAAKHAYKNAVSMENADPTFGFYK